jgi:hypothetical protein
MTDTSAVARPSPEILYYRLVGEHDEIAVLPTLFGRARLVVGTRGDMFYRDAWCYDCCVSPRPSCGQGKAIRLMVGCGTRARAGGELHAMRGGVPRMLS